MSNSDGAAGSTQRMHIGEVAERTSLSLRTIRYYEEVGLLPVAERTEGGFRLYNDDTIARLLLIKQMKPLDFTLEEMGAVLRACDQLADPAAEVEDCAAAQDVLLAFAERVRGKIDALRSRITEARAFAEMLDERGAQRPHDVLD
ncbi:MULTISPECIES: MerR family transcriptional regulator [Gordonia]|uniref:MerR family transcriptional regulator n=1 Tax=Gordonia TaxID=2053 RepID=UPI001FE21E49|nr:MerR family transcriptional regulator [Gordonia hirsuta]